MEMEELKQLVARVAEEELGENEHTRKQSLDILREWVIKHPDIRDCRTDDRFLLRFLRHRKYSVPLAQEMIIDSINLKKVIHDTIIGDVGFLSPSVTAFLNAGCVTTSPYRDNYGRTIAMCIGKNLDTKRNSWKSVLVAFRYLIDNWVEDDITQVTGLTIVMDLADMDPAICTFCPFKVMYIMLTNFQKMNPLRLKNIHFVNMSAAGTWIVQLARKFLPEKLKMRIKLHKDLQELHEEVNAKVLPKELGGDMPLSEMVELMKETLKINHEKIVEVFTSRVIGNTYKTKFGDDAGTAGSFKTLEID